MTVANYARNFDSYSGEKFTVDPAVTERGSDKFVKSTLKPASGDAIPFNYRMHQAAGGWKIEDIFLNGNISQLAQKRSDFGSHLQHRTRKVWRRRSTLWLTKHSVNLPTLARGHFLPAHAQAAGGGSTVSVRKERGNQMIL